METKIQKNSFYVVVGLVFLAVIVGLIYVGYVTNNKQTSPLPDVVEQTTENTIDSSFGTSGQTLTEKDFVGMWEPKVALKDSPQSEFAEEDGIFIYREFLNGKLNCDGVWAIFPVASGNYVLQTSCMSSEIGSEPFTTSLSVSLDTTKQELTFYDEGVASVFVRSK